MVLAILQVRMGATRLPGQEMAPVLGEPMIWRQLERIRRARMVDKVVVATSAAACDDALSTFLTGRGCSVYRGELSDVLDRFSACAETFHAAHVVRLKAESPLTDARTIDDAVGLAVRTGAAYTSNLEPRTFPEGLEVEVITAEALAAAAREARGSDEREHVAAFIRRHPRRFTQAHLTRPRDLSHLRWTVQRAEDFAFVRAVFQKLHPVDPDFGIEEVLELLEERPDLAPRPARRERTLAAPGARAA